MLIDFRTLFPKYNIKPKGVLHVGANVGEEAPVYHELGIKKAIFIEGNPAIADTLFKNIDMYPDYIGICTVISDKEGEDIDFHISNNGSQSSSILELGTHKEAHPEVYYTHTLNVKSRRIDKIFDNLDGYDFLNIDLQGAELLALKGMGDMLNGFKWVYLEVNTKELYKGCALLPEVTAYLRQFGFRPSEQKILHHWGWGDQLFIK